MSDNRENFAEQRNKHRPGIKNLLPPMQPGETRNPGGFSKKAREIYDFRRYFDEHPEEWAKIIEIGALKARRGDFRFWEATVERRLGKVPQTMEHGGTDGGPIEIRVTSPQVADNIRLLIESLKKDVPKEDV